MIFSKDLTTQYKSIEITFIRKVVVLLAATSVKVTQTSLDLSKSTLNSIDQRPLKKYGTPEIKKLAIILTCKPHRYTKTHPDIIKMF